MDKKVYKTGRMSDLNSIGETLSESLFFGVAVSLLCYGTGCLIHGKLKAALTNPLLIGSILVIIILKAFNIEYEEYTQGADLISYLLTPATVCLGVPLYEKLSLLKDNLTAVFLGIISGVIASALTIWLVCVIFTLDDTIFATMLPKSITTAIGMAASEEMGGIVNITVGMIVITGITGNIVGEAVLKLFNISNPIARGIAIGTSSHVMGTSRAIELGETEGAMSGLAVAVAGIITVVTAPVILSLY